MTPDNITDSASDRIDGGTGCNFIFFIIINCSYLLCTTVDIGYSDIGYRDILDIVILLSLGMNPRLHETHT